MIEEIEELVNEYYRSSDKDLVKPIYIKIRSYIDEWIRYQASSLRGLSEEARQDLALTVVSNILKKNLRTNVANHIRNMINERARHDRNTRIYSTIISGHHSNFDTKVKVLRKLKKLIEPLPLYVKGSVLYLMRYSDQIDRFIRNNDVATSYCVLKCIFEIRKALSMQNTDTELPDSHTSKMLLLSNLYKSNPMALAILMEVKSIDRFYQLCKLAEHNELKLPSAHEFNQLLDNSLSIGSKLDSDKVLTIADRRQLSMMVTNEVDVNRVTPDSEIIPILSQYFVQSVAVLLKNYMALQDRTMSTLDTTSPEKVKAMYEVLNREVGTQIRLIEEIITSITTAESLNNLLIKMESRVGP